MFKFSKVRRVMRGFAALRSSLPLALAHLLAQEKTFRPKKGHSEGTKR